MKLKEVTAGQLGTAADTAYDAGMTGGLAGSVGSGAASLAGKGLAKVGATGAAQTAANIGGKIAKFIPGIGMVVGTADAIRRAAAGDWTGAGLSLASGATSFIPGYGTAASLGITAAQAARDKQRTGSYIPDYDEIQAAGQGKTPAQIAQMKAAQDQPPAAQPAQAGAATRPEAPGFDPKVQELQKQILAKDPNALPKYGADGRMGKETRDAMARLGMAEGIKETKMSQRDLMRSYMDILKEQELDELRKMAKVALSPQAQARLTAAGPLTPLTPTANNAPNKYLVPQSAQLQTAIGKAKATGKIGSNVSNTALPQAQAGKTAAGKTAAGAPAKVTTTGPAKSVSTNPAAGGAGPKGQLPGSSTKQGAGTAAAAAAKKPSLAKQAAVGAAAGLGAYGLASMLGPNGEPVPTPDGGGGAVRPEGGGTGGGGTGGTGGGGAKPGPAQGSLSTAEVDELYSLANELGNVNDPQVVEIFGLFNNLVKTNKIPPPTKEYADGPTSFENGKSYGPSDASPTTFTPSNNPRPPAPQPMPRTLGPAVDKRLLALAGVDPYLGGDNPADAMQNDFNRRLDTQKPITDWVPNPMAK